MVLFITYCFHCNTFIGGFECPQQVTWNPLLIKTLLFDLQNFHLFVRIISWWMVNTIIIGNKVCTIINGSHHLHLTSLFMLIIKVLCCIHQTWTPPCNFFKINFCNYLKISTKILEMYLSLVSLLVYVNVQ